MHGRYYSRSSILKGRNERPTANYTFQFAYSQTNIAISGQAGQGWTDWPDLLVFAQFNCQPIDGVTRLVPSPCIHLAPIWSHCRLIAGRPGRQCGQTEAFSPRGRIYKMAKIVAMETRAGPVHIMSGDNKTLSRCDRQSKRNANMTCVERERERRAAE